MKFNPTKMAGCFEILPRMSEDLRGRFVKPFQYSLMKAQGLDIDFREEFYSVSSKGVLRGLHFQTPPQDQVKVVYCVQGAAFDVLVDLRKNSQTFGQFECFELSAKRCNVLYLPRGIAHGFYAREDQTTLVYKVTSEYSPENDDGILWNSMNIPWPTLKPILSPRDETFPRFLDYKSPF